MRDNKISVERKKYLKKVTRNKIIIFITQILLLVTFIAAWEICANANIIDSFITSKPSRILDTFMNLTSNDLLKHIGVTVYETIIGFLLGTVLGIIIAIILWWSDFLSKVAEPYLVVLNSLPKVALRASHHYLGRCRNSCHYRNGNSHIFNSYHIRELKWLYENR